MKKPASVVTAVVMAVVLAVILFVLFRAGVNTDFVYQKY